MVVNYYSMGLADASGLILSSGISGVDTVVFDAPSGACYFNQQKNQLYVSINSGWVGLNKQIEVHKVALGSNATATSAFTSIPMTQISISGLYMANDGSGVKVNSPGLYTLSAQTSINSIEMRFSTNLGKLSLISSTKHLIDIFQLQMNEQVNLQVRRVGGSNISLPSGQILMFMENR